MMKRFLAPALFVTMLALTSLVFSCQSQPQVVPTVEPTPTDEVLIVIVTATLQPTLAAAENTVEPTITPLATLTPVINTQPTTAPTKAATTAPVATIAAPTATTRATTAPTTRTPTRTVKPATLAPTSKPTSAPVTREPSATPKGDGLNALRYPAVVPLRPSREFRDAVNAPNAIEFTFQAVGPLEGNECYLIHADMVNPAAGKPDSVGQDFVDQAHCGDRSAPGKPLKFTLLNPRFGHPNYGDLETRALSLAPTQLLKVVWHAQVIETRGSSFLRLSPQGAALDFDFRP